MEKLTKEEIQEALKKGAKRAAELLKKMRASDRLPRRELVIGGPNCPRCYPKRKK